MRRLTILSVLVWAFLTGCSDRYWLHKARSSYEYRTHLFNAKCVDIVEPKAPAECPKIEGDLLYDYQFLESTTNARLFGPLNKDAREKLKSIASKK